MSNDMTLFNGEEAFQGHVIRVIELDGEKRMAAVDVCKALGYKDPRADWVNLKKRNAELAEELIAVKMTAFDGKQRETDTLNIEGVILLCIIAKTGIAVEFRKWAKKVLAIIIEKKYEVDNTKNLSNSEFAYYMIEMSNRVLQQEKEIAARDKLIKVKDKKIQDDRIAVEFYDNFGNKQKTKGYSWSQLGKLIQNDQDVDIGRNRLLAFLRLEKVLQSGGRNQNVPYQNYSDRNPPWFIFLPEEFELGDGTPAVDLRVLVTTHGFKEIYALVKKRYVEQPNLFD